VSRETCCWGEERTKGKKNMICSRKREGKGSEKERKKKEQLLQETAISEVRLDDDIADSGHDELDLACVRGTGEVGIDLLGLGPVQAHETIQDVLGGLFIIIATIIVAKVLAHRRHGQLLLETINLVQEEDDRGFYKPARVTDRVKECQGLLHPVHRLVLEQELVVL